MKPTPAQIAKLHERAVFKIQMSDDCGGHKLTIDDKISMKKEVREVKFHREIQRTKLNMLQSLAERIIEDGYEL